jgi:three-Cys-motif partner protein
MTDPRQIFPPKTIATKVKHRILETYLKAWGGIIINSNRKNAIRLTFVDTCCGSGLYAPGDDATVSEFDSGSALIGLNVLNDLALNGSAAGIQVETKAIFVNKERGELETLASAISAQPAGPTKHVMLPGALSDQVDSIVRQCERSFAFIFIDPFGPSAIPFTVVSRLVDLRYADCLINFPYYSVQKWSGWLGSGQQENRLQIVDALMNGSKWRELATTAVTGDDLEALLLQQYISSLTERGVGAIAVPMLFEDRARTMYHLVFTSHNTAGLAAAKEKLLKGEAHQSALRSELKSSRTNQSAFDFMAADTDLPSVDVDALATLLADHFRGRQVTFDEVIRRGLLEPHVLLGHINRALTVLKGSQRAIRAGRKWSDSIRFSAS